MKNLYGTTLADLDAKQAQIAAHTFILCDQPEPQCFGILVHDGHLDAHLPMRRQERIDSPSTESVLIAKSFRIPSSLIEEKKFGDCEVGVRPDFKAIALSPSREDSGSHLSIRDKVWVHEELAELAVSRRQRKL